jgi:signal transduction histidine kinase
MFLIASVLLAYWSVKEEESHLQHEVSSKVSSLALVLSSGLEQYRGGNTAEDRASYVRSVIPSDIKDELFVNLYGSDGELLGSISGPITHAHQAPDKIDINKLRHSGIEATYEFRNVPHVSYLAPIESQDGTITGAIEVMLPLEHSQEVLSGVVQRFLNFIVITAVLLGILVFLIIRWGISFPITNLMEASKTLGKGNMGLRLGKTNVAELDELIEEFNRMAENLEKQTQETSKIHQEKIQFERNLKHTEKLAAIGQLTSGLAHEIGTPLNVIQGRAENLLGKSQSGSKERKNLILILEQTERITEIIQQLLSYSRKPRGVLRKVSLTSIIQEAFTISKLKLSDSEVSVELELKLEAEELYGDEESLKQLFVNLILNSFHALKSKGTIRIKSYESKREDKDVSVIQFEDDGPGIPQEYISRVTDPFFTTKDVGEGTGLGLFIVSNILDEHGGTIEIGKSSKGGVLITMAIPSTQQNNTGDILTIGNKVERSL